ncbi:MAG: NDP-sugar synthase [Candidatus Methanomethylophilaceae archaeon]|jgi:mannose-1-phosphate guanylyltransferase
MTSDVRQAVIMVGGKGTRLRPLTETKPKPILPVLDKPCLRYLIESLVDAGITEVILACGYRSDQMTEAIGDGSDLGITIEYSYEDEPRGTGGAIKLIEDRLDDTFVAANGDVFADISVKGEIEKHRETNAALTIALTPVKNPCEFGIARLDESDRILEFKEKPKPEEVFSDLVNAGVYIVEKRLISEIPPDTFYDFSKDLFPMMLQRGDRIQGYILGGVWRDVGRPADLLGANLAMATKRYDGYLWGGKNIKGCEIRKPFFMGKDCELVDSNIVASVVLRGSAISSSKISNSMIMADCKVDGAKIQNSIIGEGCVIKEGASISNMVLGDGTIVEKDEVLTETRV